MWMYSLFFFTTASLNDYPLIVISYTLFLRNVLYKCMIPSTFRSLSLSFCFPSFLPRLHLSLSYSDHIETLYQLRDE